MKRRPPAGNVRLVQHVHGNQRYVITSKAGDTVQLESHLERKLAYRTDRDPVVKRYTSQPETLTGTNDAGRHVSYTPDFKIEYFDGRIELHEVTLDARRSKASSLAREALGRKICTERGWKYIVHTREVLPGDTELANLARFYMFRATSYLNTDIAKIIRGSLTPSQPVYALQFVNDLSDLHGLQISRLYPVLCHMIWHSQVEIDWLIRFFDGVLPDRKNGKVWLVGKEQSND